MSSARPRATELDALCLARYRALQAAEGLCFRAALPKNNYGKILKTELRARDKDADANENDHND